MRVVKLFMLGKPGCGKSTLARCIETQARDDKWSFQRLNDYPILQKMFAEDEQKSQGERRFRWLDENDKALGFDVLDFAVLDQALCQLEQETNILTHQYETTSAEKFLVLLEFARNDYQRAFTQFSLAFLQDAYFLYLSTDVEVCKKRICQRVSNPQTEDDYNVSDYIFQAYYNHKDDKSLEEFLRNRHVDMRRVKVFDNNVDVEEAWQSQTLNEFMERVFHKSACVTMS